MRFLLITLLALIPLSGILGFSMASPERAPAPKAFTVIALGDSVTAGYFESGVRDQASAWPTLLQPALMEALPDRTVTVINSGVAGDTAADALDRLDRDVLRYAPDVVVVAFGLNDVADGPEVFRRSLEELVRRIGSDRVVLVTPNFMTPVVGQTEGEFASLDALFAQWQQTGRVATIAIAVRSVAHEHDIPVADVHADWQHLADTGHDISALLANGLNHPAREMHPPIADTVFEAMRPHLPER